MNQNQSSSSGVIIIIIKTSSTIVDVASTRAMQQTSQCPQSPLAQGVRKKWRGEEKMKMKMREEIVCMVG